ncbi:MAG: hypothetical protein IJ136_07180 [Erysipelotrichaceae bacterium]|nr:hypothetical protein [Erysipelotrichaceae bacterium]
MELNDYRKKDYMPFCIEEIKEAFRKGIDPRLIEEYMADTDLGNLQLRQIRLGLEEELDVSAYARVTMSAGDMEQIRLRLLKEKQDRDLQREEAKKLLKEKTKGEVYKLRLHNTLSIFRILLILALIAVTILLYFIFEHLYDLYNEDLFIEFRNENITLEYKEPFLPEKQVKDCSKGNSIIVIYPSFSADELGEFTVTYQLSNGLKSIREDLNIEVIDSTPPVLLLKEEEIMLIRDVDEFVAEDNIEEISDNYDDEVDLEVSDINWELDEQEIVFTAIDDSDNQTRAVLKLILKDRPKQENKTASGNSTDKKEEPSAESNSSSIGASDPKPSPVSSESVKAEVYCHNVTVSLGTDPGTAAYSTYDGLSGTITISIQYPELNTSSPGTYPVYYINTTTGETVAVAYVTVIE